MAYIFKGMYTSPLPAGDTDGDRNIQALGNQFLWCCFPCGALCWQTELDINSPSGRWTNSLCALSKLCHHFAHHYLPWALKSADDLLGLTLLKKPLDVVKWLVWTTGLSVSRSCLCVVPVTFHPHGKAKDSAELSTCMTHIMEPLHLHRCSFRRLDGEGWYSGEKSVTDSFCSSV